MPYQQLLQSIADTIVGYRQGQIQVPTTAHVERWVNQFSPGTQLAVLQEMDHVLRKHYITEDSFRAFINMLTTNADLVGPDPQTFWRHANILGMQGRGHSQAVMLQMFDECLQRTCGLRVQQCGSPAGPYIYLDDGIFSGGQLTGDLARWIKDGAPPQATVHVIAMISHTSAEYYAKQVWLSKINKETGKNISLEFWRCYIFENRNYYSYTADVYWPATMPAVQSVQAYVSAEKKYPLKPRTAGGGNQVFSGEPGRQVLEQEFLIAGTNIVNRFDSTAYRRPLGYGRFGVGFGATMVTYRNCPNNAPLALWWGDNLGQNGPLGWYPLLPRETRDQNFIRQAFANI